MIAKPTKFERDVAKWKRQRAKDTKKRKDAMRERVEWQLTCNAIFKRDGGECRVCHKAVRQVSANPELRAETHHIVYRSAGGSDDESNLVLLCAQCHADEHAHRIEISGCGDSRVIVTGAICTVSPRHETRTS